MKILILCLTVFFSLTTLAANEKVATKNEPAVAADNSGINKRDDSVVELTAQDQSNSSEAIEITRKIRADLNKNDSLSTYAKNVKIITSGKLVVLKGPVRSADEVAIIRKAAVAAAPKYKIQNELEVTKK